MRPVHRLFVHHSASPPATSPDTIRGWHLARGFRDIGYHALVWLSPDGWVSAPGRPPDEQGAHVLGHNADSLGICLCGDYRTDSPDPEALRILVVILEAWCREYSLDPHTAILGHRDGQQTICPGPKLYALLPTIRERVAHRLIDPTADPWPWPDGIAIPTDT